MERQIASETSSFLLPFPEHDKFLASWNKELYDEKERLYDEKERWEGATYLDGTCRSICIFSFSLIYFTQIPEDHIWCASLCAARGKAM